MKKKKLKSLHVNKEKISSLAAMQSIKGASWICTGATCFNCPHQGQTNEGPCPGGTSGCIPNGCHIP
ncbi:hypothetical protein [uncultured Kordia sp.]|uniref:hypothetical protein n=1 Tax=uncultured Kordia sp. TaxID=507699 RepID=UPI002632049B|nr:hypothetical protein [uncultured Kordia sp.]